MIPETRRNGGGMARKEMATLSVRIDPQLQKRVKIRVAQMGRPWTLARFTAEALAHLLQRKTDDTAA